MQCTFSEYWHRQLIHLHACRSIYFLTLTQHFPYPCTKYLLLPDGAMRGTRAWILVVSWFTRERVFSRTLYRWKQRCHFKACLLITLYDDWQTFGFKLGKTNKRESSLQDLTSSAAEGKIKEIKPAERLSCCWQRTGTWVRQLSG